MAGYLRKAPKDFPDPLDRKKRQIEQLELAPPPPPPKPPTKEERQAQKKRDHQLLNMLKIRIQPVMDQIKLKYRKFRTGVIEEDQIKYLFDEQDSNNPSSEVAPPQLFRPFEKAVDKDGIEGLLEVESQKFFYNLNIVTIEERLSNGYYKRPKDYTADIRCLAKDARACGDRERTIKANEMLANVEVDMTALEQDPYLADCENVYLREMQRAKERSEKRAKELEAEAATDSNLQSSPNMITAGPANTSDQPSTGPVQLGEPVPRAGTLLPVTPSRSAQAHSSSLSNGVSVGPDNSEPSNEPVVQSNGSSVPSRGDGDVHMADAAEGQKPTSADPPTAPKDTLDVFQKPSYTKTSAQKEQSGLSNPSGPVTQPSQKSIITSMPPGSQAEDFVNDASTTTSGEKKASDQSNRSSDRWNTQSSNGVNGTGPKDVPDYAGIVSKAHGDSQLPDTQGSWPQGEGLCTGLTQVEATSSQGSGPHSSQSQMPSHQNSQPPVPAFNAPSRSAPSTSIQALLNKPTSSDSHPEWIVDHAFIDGLHEAFTERTSGCSIEQLEQVNTALMDSIWRQRGEWNRTKTGTEVMRVFNEIMHDIEDMQEVLPASLATQ